jgi:hypothetical protein
VEVRWTEHDWDDLRLAVAVALHSPGDLVRLNVSGCHKVIAEQEHNEIRFPDLMANGFVDVVTGRNPPIVPFFDKSTLPK